MPFHDYATGRTGQQTQQDRTKSIGYAGPKQNTPVAPGEMRAFSSESAPNYGQDMPYVPSEQERAMEAERQKYSPEGAWQNWTQWSGLWDAMQSGQDPRGALTSIMGKGFQGGHQRDLGFFLEHPAWRHMMALSLKDSDAWKKLAGMSGDQVLSAGMGQIGAQGKAAVDQGLQSLAQSGMGRSPGARAAVERQARVSTGQAGANLQSQVYGMETQRLGQLLGLEQQMQQIALGQGFNERSNPSNKPGAGDWMSLVGSLAGAGAIAAAACWVAREVYGEDNPKWLLFRHWLFTMAPAWFRKLYLRHGPKVATFLRRVPILKPLVRKWMDGRIASLHARFA